MMRKMLFFLVLPVFLSIIVLVDGQMLGNQASRLRGIIICIDAGTETIQVRQNGRLVHIKASRVLCEANKGNLNKRVVVIYDRRKDGALIAKSIEPAPRKMVRHNKK